MDSTRLETSLLMPMGEEGMSEGSLQSSPVPQKSFSLAFDLPWSSEWEM
jgi:hypothetical protein